MANSELNAASRLKTWSIGAERRYDLIYRNHGWEAHTEKEITKSRPYIRWMAHLQPAMVQTGSCDDVRCHWTVEWRQLEYRIKGQRPNVCMSVWLTETSKCRARQPPLVIGKIEIGQKIMGYVQAATKTDVPSGVEIGTAFGRRHCESTTSTEIRAIIFERLLR